MTIALLVALSLVGHVTPCTALLVMGLVTMISLMNQLQHQLPFIQLVACVANPARTITNANKVDTIHVASVVTSQAREHTTHVTNQMYGEGTRKHQAIWWHDEILRPTTGLNGRTEAVTSLFM